MGCCGIKGDKEGEEDDKRARKQNKEIEKQIQKDKQVIIVINILPFRMYSFLLLFSTDDYTFIFNKISNQKLLKLGWFLTHFCEIHS